MDHPAGLVRGIAQDLTTLHDPDLILTSLVRRVRASLGCDLAYVSLNDPEARETRIRFADGVHTSEYAAIRMPIGTGVLGLAAAGVTTESPDYLPDAARLHIEAVDIAVHAEGVRAILGTPLRAGGEVIGALTVANRTPGGFGAEQRAALEEAALVASSAVEVYRLRHEADQRRRAHEEQLALLRERAIDSDAQLALTQQLLAALSRGEGSRQLTEIAAAAIGGTVRLGEQPPSGESSAQVLPLEVGGSVEVSGADSRIRAALAPTIAGFLSVALLYEHAIDDARHFREAELVERLVEPAVHLPGPPPRSALPGTGPLEVIVAEIDDPLALRSALARARRMLGPRAISAMRRGSATLIARSADDLRPILRDALQPFRYYAGVASTDDDVGLPAASAEAALLATAARRLGRADRLTSWDDLGVVALAVGGGPADARDFVTAQIAAISGDSARDRALRQTARHFLDTQGSVPEVARRLAIHENTVRQRLARLDQLIPGWRRGDRSLDVHVALRAHLLLDG